MMIIEVDVVGVVKNHVEREKENHVEREKELVVVVVKFRQILFITNINMIYLVPSIAYSYFVTLTGNLAQRLFGSFEHEPIFEGFEN